MTTSYEYPLGYSVGEARRLEVQAKILGETLAEVLRKAGLQKGMQVLDLGCGIGDVSFLAAKMVGRTGSVLGVDRATTSILEAERRAARSRLTNISFRTAELEMFYPDEAFDAVIGRFILLYLADPSRVLGRLRTCIRRGGIVVMQELDMSTASQYPPSELFNVVNKLIFGAFDAGKAEKDMGSKLLSTFLESNLPWPVMSSITPVTSGEDSPYYAILTEMIRSMMPVIEKSGTTTQAEVQLETLARRLQEDAVLNRRVLFPPRIVSAWCTVL
jgi:ubiquinone/menaquinone biosynthesis C-methylase UbiE